MSKEKETAFLPFLWVMDGQGSEPVLLQSMFSADVIHTLNKQLRWIPVQLQMGQQQMKRECTYVIPIGDRWKSSLEDWSQFLVPS